MGTVAVWLALNTLSAFTVSNAAKAMKIDKNNAVNESIEAMHTTGICTALCAIFPQPRTSGRVKSVCTVAEQRAVTCMQ